MPNVLLEAMSCRMICIGSDISGIRENIKNGKNGFLFQTGNIEQLSEKLKLSLMNEYKNLGTAAKEFIVKERNPYIVFKEYLHLFT